MKDEAAQARDGQPLPSDRGTCAFVPDPLLLGWLQTVELRSAVLFVFELVPGTDFANHDLIPTDRVRMTHERSGLDAAVMEVEGRTITETGSVMVVLRRVDDPDGEFAASLAVDAA